MSKIFTKQLNGTPEAMEVLKRCLTEWGIPTDIRPVGRSPRGEAIYMVTATGTTAANVKRLVKGDFQEVPA
jgi:hypothetical protein